MAERQIVERGRTAWMCCRCSFVEHQRRIELTLAVLHAGSAKKGFQMIGVLSERLLIQATRLRNVSAAMTHLGESHIELRRRLLRVEGLVGGIDLRRLLRRRSAERGE